MTPVITGRATDLAGKSTPWTATVELASLKPIMGAVAEGGNYSNLAPHLYQSLTSPVPATMPPLVNVQAGGKQARDWAGIIAGNYDAAMRQVAAVAAASRSALVLLHEPMAFQGSPADYNAAYSRLRGVAKSVAPSLMVGPCYLGEWADPGWTDNVYGATFDAWCVPTYLMDFLGFDKYWHGAAPADWGKLVAPWTAAGAARGKKLLHAETAAVTGPALTLYQSMLAQLPSRSDVLGVWLWLSSGPGGDYRVSTLTAAEKAALDALAASPLLGRTF